MWIRSVGELIEFKDNVNNGTSYSGMTVFLDSDMDFTGKVFERIGTSSKCQLRGVFDGQGHVVSNLNMNSSSSQNAGLFGYSEGRAIKNVILGSSYSITSVYIGSDRVLQER